MKKFKKSVSVLLVAVMMLCSAPLASMIGLELPNLSTLFNFKAEAATYTSGYYTYVVSDGEAYIKDVDTSISGDVEIPSTLGGYPVATIGNSAFSGCKNMTSVIIPDSVKSIQQAAFGDCENLTYVSMGSGLITVELNVFYDCINLTTVMFNSDIDFYAPGVFKGCTNLKTIVFGENVKNINGVKEYLKYTKSIEKISVSASNENYSTDEYGILYDKNKTELIWCPAGNTITNFTIANSVTAIDEYAFCNCGNLKSVTTGNGVTSIDDYAFYGCTNLVNVSIGSSVTNINYRYAFSGCTNLSSITVSNSNQSFLSDEDGVVFNKDKTELIYYPRGNSRKVYTIPNSVTSVGNYSFSDCTILKSVTIPDSVTSIGIYAFSDCTSLANITISNNITSIGAYAFENTAVYNNSSYWENDVLYIGKYLIAAEVSGTYDIKEGTKIIADGAFYSCSNLASITIPESVISIGIGSFYNCTGLTNLVIPNGVKTIAPNSFFGCTNLTHIELPDSLNSIGNLAFAGCSVITSINIPSGITSINYGTFRGCECLTSVSIEKNITSIGDSAFYYCESISDVYYAGSKDEWNKIVVGKNNENLTNATIHFASSGETTTPSENVYNLGEETYSFDNFGDSDSAGGHCFGMSVTSSGYYTGELDVSSIGLDSSDKLYTLNLTAKVKDPICYYQSIQGSRRNKAIVAGGKPFRTPYYDIASDWTEIVNYVKNHDHDNNGTLQVVDYVKSKGSGHAMNFLYYSNVNGQDRIYVYDNNFPDVETYFYKDSNGKIRQAPKATFSSVDSIGLLDVKKYLASVENFDFTHVIYAYEGEISIEGAEGYPMLGAEGEKTRYMYEIPENIKKVEIVPLVDNAEFKYLEEDYTFSAVNDTTVGELKLATLEGEDSSPNFTITNGGAATSMDIRTPSTTTISYGDAIILHADVQNLPAGGYVEWTANNGNFDFDVSSDGLTCKITPSSSGDTTFTATVYDADRNVISSDTREMTSKAGFFQKIIAFFKRIFGLTKTIPEMFR